MRDSMLWLTSRKRVVGRIVSVISRVDQNKLGDIPNIQWSGKKPSMARRRVALRGEALADTVLEMR